MENLLSLLLQARNAVHVLHWKTKSFSLHLALGELYDILTDMADELAEMTMGAHGDLGEIPLTSLTIPTGLAPEAFIQQLFDILSKIKPSIPQDDWLINKFEELQAAVATIKYKIENLK